MNNNTNRNSPFPLDSTIYVAAHHSDEVVEYTVVGQRIDEKHAVLFCDSFPSLELTAIYLGDRGVPGFAYDNRPNQIFTTQEDAEHGLIAARNWWHSRNNNRSEDF